MRHIVWERSRVSADQELHLKTGWRVGLENFAIIRGGKRIMAMRGSVVQEDAGGNAQVGRRSLLKGVAAVFSGAASISAMPSFASAMPTTDTEKATGQRPLRASSTD